MYGVPEAKGNVNFSLSASGENTAQETQEGAEAPTLSKTFYEARQAVLDADYGVTEADIDSAWRKAQSGEKMTETEALAYDELTAKMMAEVLGNETSIRRMASKAPKLARSILRRIGDLIDSLRGSNASKEELRRLRKAEQLFEDALAEIKETKESALKDYQKAEKALYKKAGAARRGYERDRKEYRKLKGTVTQEELDAWLREHDYTEEDFADDVLEGEYSVGNVESGIRTIAADMPEAERAAILEKQSLSPVDIRIPEEFDLNIDHLERNMKSAVEKPLLKKLGELGLLKSYKSTSVDIDFELTGAGVRKSMNSQVTHYGGNLSDFSKVVLNVQELLDTAALIEVHTDKAKGTPKENPRLERTYVLLSAFCENNSVDGNERKFITPVQFEIKQYIDNNNRLYLAVALTKIETSVMGDTVLQDEERTRLLPVSNISISQLIQKINPRDENFFKYIPDKLLNQAQLDAKRRALDKEAKKYGRTENVNFSLSKKSDKVLISKGEQQKQRAEYQSDRVYHKKDVVETVKSVKALRLLPNKARNELIDELWRGINYRYHEVHTIENVSNSPASTNHGTEAGHITADNKYIVSHDFDPSRKNENKNGSPIQTNPRKSVEQTVSRATTPDNSIHQIEIGVKKNKFFITATRCSAKRTLRPL